MTNRESDIVPDHKLYKARSIYGDGDRMPFQKGDKGFWLGKKRDVETNKKVSESRKKRKELLGYINSPDTRKKQGISQRKRFEKYNERKKLSETRKKLFAEGKIPRPIGCHQKGKESSNWHGGISFDPYSPEFNKELKNKIKIRDSDTCQNCGYKGNERQFHIHHIDYNKKNSTLSNLILLCCHCHHTTGFKREDWKEYFKGVVKNG